MTAPVAPDPTTAAPARRPPIPRLARRVELHETDQGDAEATLRGTRRFRLSPEAAWLLRQIDGQRTLDDIAARLSQRHGQAVSAEDVRELLARTLVSQGLAVLAPEPEVRPRVVEAPRLLTLASAEHVARVAPLLAPLTHPAFAVPLAGASLALIAAAALAEPAANTAAAWRNPLAWALALPVLALSMLAHEWAHAAALARAGRTPGAITLRGGGVSWTATAHLGDIRDLPRGTRVAIDLAGVDAQLVVAGAVVAIARALHAPAPWPVIALLLASIAFNLWPASGRDGRWVLDDLAGHEPGSDLRRFVPPARWIRYAYEGLRMRVLFALGLRRRDPLLRILPVFVSASFPAWPAAKLRAHTLGHLISRERSRLDTAEIGRGGLPDVIRHTRTIRALRARGQGAVVCGMHIGPFQYVPLALGQLGADMAAYAAPHMQQRHVDDWTTAARKLGVEFDLLSPKSASNAARGLRAVRQGRMLVIYMDGQHSSNRDQHRADFTFLGTDLYMRTGPALLARRADAPIVLAATYREGVATRVVEFSDEFAPPIDDSEEALYARTAEMYAWFSRIVDAHKPQWEGWMLPLLHWRATGSAPTATVEQVETALAEARALLDGSRPHVRLAADEGQSGWSDILGEPLIVHGPTRRVLIGSPRATALLDAAHAGWCVRERPKRLRESSEALAPDLARLVLAGLARYTG